MATFRKEIKEHFPESDGSSLVFLNESDKFQFVVTKDGMPWKLVNVPAKVVRDDGVGESWGPLIEQFKEEAEDAKPPVPKQQSKTSSGSKATDSAKGTDGEAKEPAADPAGGSKPKAVSPSGK